MGAWIEISVSASSGFPNSVAPHMGAWIEIIGDMSNATAKQKSHPTWVRGLKFLPLPSLLF